MAVNEQAAPLDQDEATLHQMGYAQELRRRMSGFSNFAVSFTIISILSGCLTLYGFGMTTGGPVVIVWGWLFVGVMTLFVGLAMAEVCSSYPTAGGLYYWSAKLARQHGPAWSWFTGWFNFLGQVAVTAGIDFGAAFFINAFGALVWGWSTAHSVTILIYAIVLLVHGLLNQFGIRLVALLNDVSVWWHIIGVLLIVGVLIFVPSHHQSASFVFGHFVNDTGLHIAPIYIVLIGLLLAQYTFTGYDASAHMTEETHNAATQRAAGHRDVDLRLADRRLGAADRDHVRHPALRSDAYLGHRGAARADLHRRRRDGLGQVPAAGGDRRPAVLRDVLGHRQLPDDLRVLPGRRAARLGLLAPGQQADPHPDQRDLAGRRGRAHPGPALPVEQHRVRGGHLDRGHRPVHRLRDPDLPAAAPGRQASSAARGTWAGGASRSASSRSPGWRSSRSCSCCRRSARSPGLTFNYAVFAVAAVIGFAGIYWLVSARNWFNGPRVQGTPEELAAIEQELSA